MVGVQTFGKRAPKARKEGRRVGTGERGKGAGWGGVVAVVLWGKKTQRRREVERVAWSVDGF